MFSSGIRHATWLLGLTQIETSTTVTGLDADGDDALRLMLFPKQAAELVDTWQVSGLRGTGSFDFCVTDLFVPHERAIWATSTRRHERGTLYLFSSSGIFGPTFGAVALGIAAAALGEIIALAADKTPRGIGRTVRESQVVQAEVAKARARLDAARLYLRQTIDEIWREAERTGELTLEQRVRSRLAATHATHEACAVVDVAYEAAGSSAILATHPFERRFRDVHAVQQQVQGRATHYETVGRYLLGLDPATAFL
jgi:alkylation response protein AidB-like acyl-CoA dehydrogenase